MHTLQLTTLYIFSFIALYAQVFLLVAAINGRKKIEAVTTPLSDEELPPVTVIVPCWNEERTVKKTVDSLLALDYPQSKLIIKMINDGSTDGTWEAMQAYAGIPNIELIKKENGGKHTAMNLGLSTTITDFVGCLDADAFVEPDALKKIMWHFNDPKAMSVSPSILVHNPKGVFQKAQNAEYNMGVFVKKILGLVNGIHVTPGPFTIYRKKVFDDLGGYRKAHNTEDMEIAYRMQVNGYKIVQCHDAFVHTVTPKTFKTLYKQRLRWMYGFINNSIDYRKYLLKPKHGVFSLYTVPTGAIALLAPIFLISILIIQFGIGVYNFVVRMQVTNFFIPSPTTPQFSFFFINSEPIAIIMLVLNLGIIAMILYGQKMRKKHPVPTMSLVYFLFVYSVMSPLWLGKAIYNTLASRETAWR